MNPSPYANVAAGGYAANTAKDASDLNLLSVLHYVWSALLGCGTLGIVGYFILLGGVFGVSATSGGADPKGAAVAAGATIAVGLVVGVMMGALFVVHLLAASGLRKRKRRVLIMIASALMCTSVPLGTLLGVFTFIVLGRPGAKALFEAS